MNKKNWQNAFVSQAVPDLSSTTDEYKEVHKKINFPFSYVTLDTSVLIQPPQALTRSSFFTPSPSCLIYYDIFQTRHPREKKKTRGQMKKNLRVAISEENSGFKKRKSLLRREKNSSTHNSEVGVEFCFISKQEYMFGGGVRRWKSVLMLKHFRYLCWC